MWLLDFRIWIQIYAHYFVTDADHLNEYCLQEGSDSVNN